MSGKPFGEGPMNWSPGMPSSNREFSCVAMSAGPNLEWIDADCDQKKMFICEYLSCQGNKDQDREALMKKREGLHMHQNN
jgi:hypothetical protein